MFFVFPYSANVRGFSRRLGFRCTRTLTLVCWTRERKEKFTAPYYFYIRLKNSFNIVDLYWGRVGRVDASDLHAILYKHRVIRSDKKPSRIATRRMSRYKRNMREIRINYYLFILLRLHDAAVEPRLRTVLNTRCCKTFLHARELKIVAGTPPRQQRLNHHKYCCGVRNPTIWCHAMFY